MPSNNHVIIVAGGIGSRINNSVPKQFIEINNKPVIIHTIEKFIAFNNSINIYISVVADYFDILSELINTYFPNRNIKLTTGGETRFHSVINALELIPDKDGIVGIHDAARPMVAIETIKRCYDKALTSGNATPCVPINESIRLINKNENKSVMRTDYRIIQTPQCFNLIELKKAFKQDYIISFTDDASVFEKAGHKINLVDGNIENIKITYPIDLVLAQHYLK